MNRFVSANYIGKLVFQGSQDGIHYIPIFTVSTEIHEGWNYYNLLNSNLAENTLNYFRYYRFYGTYGACVIGEVIFTGIELIND
jgi:hypothetical protein